MSRFKIIPIPTRSHSTLSPFISSQSRCVEFKMILCDFNPVKSQDTNVQSILPNSPDFHHFRYIRGKHPSRHLQNLSKLIINECTTVGKRESRNFTRYAYRHIYAGKFSSVMSKLFSYLRASTRIVKIYTEAANLTSSSVFQGTSIWPINCR